MHRIFNSVVLTVKRLLNARVFVITATGEMGAWVIGTIVMFNAAFPHCTPLLTNFLKVRQARFWDFDQD